MIKSQHIAIDRFFMKLFQTSSINIVRLCQSCLNFELPSVRWEKTCVAKSEQKLLNSQNLFCKLQIYFVVDDLSDFSKGQAFECFHCYKQVHIVITCCAYCLFLISLYFCFRFCLLYIFVFMYFFF